VSGAVDRRGTERERRARRRRAVDEHRSVDDRANSELRVPASSLRARVVGEGAIKAHKGKQDLIGGKFVWTDTFVKQGGQWKVVASQITPVLEK